MPGVGHKTASVVMSQGFGFPAFPVDTHTFIGWLKDGVLTNGKNVIQTEKDLKNIFQKILEQASSTNNLVWKRIL